MYTLPPTIAFFIHVSCLLKFFAQNLFDRVFVCYCKPFSLIKFCFENMFFTFHISKKSLPCCHLHVVLLLYMLLLSYKSLTHTRRNKKSKQRRWDLNPQKKFWKLLFYQLDYFSFKSFFEIIFVILI